MYSYRPKTEGGGWSRNDQGREGCKVGVIVRKSRNSHGVNETGVPETSTMDDYLSNKETTNNGGRFESQVRSEEVLSGEDKIRSCYK